MILKNITLDDADTIIQPCFHDALLTGINIIENNSLKLSFQLVNNSYINLCLMNVVSLNVIEFGMGNIVLDMTISKIDKEIDDYVRKGVNKAMGYDTNHLTEQEIIRLNSKNGLLLFCLFPSYGAEIYCVCENIVLE